MYKATILFLAVFFCSDVSAQDSIIRDSARKKLPFAVRDSLRMIDSAENARLQKISDSIAFSIIRRPDSLRKNQFLDSLIPSMMYKGFWFLNEPPPKQQYLQRGKLIPRNEGWIIFAILGLYVYLAILNYFFGKDIGGFFRSFYSKRIFNQFTREENLFKSTSFIAVFGFFGCVIGMFLYILGQYFQIGYLLQGPQLLLALTLTIIGLFALKLIVLKLLGFIFDIQKLVSAYISVVYISYFNLSFAFLPILTCISLMGAGFSRPLFWITGLLLGAVIVMQFLRGSIDILSTARFRKTYLILYLCALEICPVIILIKALKL